MIARKKIENAIVSITSDKRETLNGKYRLYIRVSWQFQTSLFSIGAAVHKKYWPHLYTSRVPEVKAAVNKAFEELDRYCVIIRELLCEGQMSMLHVAQLAHRKMRKITYLDEIIRIIYDEKTKEKKINTAATYKYLLRSIEVCYAHRLRIVDVDVIDFIRRLKLNSNSDTTIGIRLRTLKAVYNRLIKMKIVKENPFDNVTIPRTTSSKRYLDAETLEKIKKYAFADEALEGQKCVRLWLLSYYMQGINITDMVRLKVKDYNRKNNVITFVRQKTKQRIVIPVNDKILCLIKMLSDSAVERDDYLIDYLDEAYSEAEIVRHVGYLVRHINKTMKKLFGPGISTYTARHTFATNMLRAGASTEIIQSCLGHASVTTTQIYLSGFDNSQIAKYTSQL